MRGVPRTGVDHAVLAFRPDSKRSSTPVPARAFCTNRISTPPNTAPEMTQQMVNTASLRHGPFRLGEPVVAAVAQAGQRASQSRGDDVPPPVAERREPNLRADALCHADQEGVRDAERIAEQRLDDRGDRALWYANSSTPASTARNSGYECGHQDSSTTYAAAARSFQPLPSLVLTKLDFDSSEDTYVAFKSGQQQYGAIAVRTDGIIHIAHIIHCPSTPGTIQLPKFEFCLRIESGQQPDRESNILWFSSLFIPNFPCSKGLQQ